MEQKKLNIDATPEVMMGEYSNMAMISHSSADFIIDFLRTLPNANPSLRSRIVMAPEHAKRLLLALQDNIQKYESAFGRIDIHNPNMSRTATPFGPSNAEA